jgi:UDP-glucose 4-epimerase
MSLVLVTGVAGFIGSNLARRLLDEGFDVRGIDNLSAGLIENVPGGVDFHCADIRSQVSTSLFAGVDTVFHLAAKNCLSECLVQPIETSDVNVTGTLRVLEACRAHRVRKFVFASTSATYEGIDVFPSPVDRVAPVGTYAVSKRSAEMFCATYRDLFEMRVTILRYFNVYGPGQDWRRAVPPVMSAFIIKLLKGERPVIYGNGEKRRDFIHVDDVNAFHLLAVKDSRTDGRTYNVGSGLNHSVNEIFREVAFLLNSNVEPLQIEELAGEADSTLADITNERALGWEPRVDLRAGLKRMIQHILENNVAGVACR